MKNILFLGTNPKQYEYLGNIIHFPMIEISKTKIDSKLQESILSDLSSYDLIIFTSRFGVQFFFQWLKERDYSLTQFENMDFAVIGEVTKNALEKFNLNHKVVADVETSEGLWEQLKSKYDLKGKRILFPRSSLSNPFLIDQLRTNGCQVDEVAIYQNTKPAKRDLPQEEISSVVFTSPSTVRNFLKDYGTIPKSWGILAKGPRTSKELETHGYVSEVVNQ